MRTFSFFSFFKKKKDRSFTSYSLYSLLFTRVPEYEQLASVEKESYHFEKEKYNMTARLDADSLYFARPVTLGETWAKLHCDYASAM